MSLGAIKVLVTAITGTAGVGAISPFAYTEATREHHKTLWKKTLNGVGPVITCDDHQKYEVELVVLGGGSENNLGLGFKVFETEVGYWRNTRSESKKEFAFKDGWETMGEAKVELAWKNGEAERDWKDINNCKWEETGIKWKTKSRDIFRTKKEIKSVNDKFEIVKCEDYSFSKICEIKIDESSDLDWSNLQNPKITYSPF